MQLRGMGETEMTTDSCCPRGLDGIAAFTSGRLPRRRGSRLKALGVFAALAASLAIAILPGAMGDAHAQRMLAIAAPKRTASVNVAVGKSQDIGTDSSFVDILVGDPEIADINPLTDKMISILGKKIGTTRVSLYDESKKLV